jgi:antitoxin ParD1/3/4
LQTSDTDDCSRERSNNLNISLTPQLEEMIRAQVDSGKFNSASEVVREALRMMQEREANLERMRAEIQIGLDQLERGEAVEFTEDTLERLMKEAAENSRQGKPVRDVVKL